MGLEHSEPHLDGIIVRLDTDHRNLTFLLSTRQGREREGGGEREREKGLSIFFA